MVGVAQRGAHVDLGVPGQVGGHEQQVADLVLQALPVVAGPGAGELGAHLLDLLVQLGDHRFMPGPVETGARRARLQLQRALPLRQPARDAGQRRVVLLTGGGTFGTLDLFPVGGLLARIGEAGVGEHVRMPAHHLVGDRGDNVVEAEGALLGGHLRVEDDLQQQVAQFILQPVQVVAVDRVGDLVGLFDGVRGDCREILLQVPGAAVLRIAQAGHDRKQAVDGSCDVVHGVGWPATTASRARAGPDRPGR